MTEFEKEPLRETYERLVSLERAAMQERELMLATREGIQAALARNQSVLDRIRSLEDHIRPLIAEAP